MSENDKKAELLKELERVSILFEKQTGRSRHSMSRPFWRQNKKSQSDYDSYFNTFEDFKSSTGGVSREDIDIQKKHSAKELKRYFITAVMPEAEVMKNAIESIQAYQEHSDAELVVIPMRGIHHTHKYYSDSVMKLSDHFCTELDIGKKLKAIDLQIYASSKNIFSDAHEFAVSWEKSLIIAHVKQDMQSVYVKDSTKPKIVLSTGTITDRKFQKTASGFRGRESLVPGGIVVEIDPESNRFYWRNVQFDSRGGFHVNRHYFSPAGEDASNIIYAVCPDTHFGFEVPEYVNGFIDMVNEFKIPEVGLNDIMDSYSISHWHINDMMTLAKKVEIEHFRTLENELNFVGNKLKEWAERMPETRLNIIPSNHHEHIERYLTNQRYVNEPHNFRLALELSGELLKDKNPLEYYIKTRFPELNERVNFYGRNQSVIISKRKYNIVHGHIGPGMGPLTRKLAKKSYGRVSQGHVHAPFKDDEIMCAGSMADGFGYAKDRYSNSFPAPILHYENGQRTFCWIAPDGKYRI